MNPEQQQGNILAACYTYSHHLDLWPQSFHRSFTPKDVAFSLHDCTATNTSLQELIFSNEHHLLCSVCAVLRDGTAPDRLSVMSGVPHAWLSACCQLLGVTACLRDVQSPVLWQKEAYLDGCCSDKDNHNTSQKDLP